MLLSMSAKEIVSVLANFAIALIQLSCQSQFK